MPEISKIVLPGGTYDIKDAVARSTAAGGIQLKGTTTTALTDEATTNPITIGGSSYTAVAQDAVFYNKKEFVYDGTKWHEFGDMSGLGDLSQKDSASATYTPAGSVSQPTFTGTDKTVNVSGTASGSVTISTGSGTSNYTPSGSVSRPSFTGDELTSTGTFTPAGNISSATNDSGNYQPAGSITVTENASGTAFQAKGTISTPTISVQTAGTTTTVNSITDVGTLPELSMTVTGETLTISFDAGTLPTKGANTTVKTGDATYQSTQPTFTGQKYNVSFSGTKVQLGFSGTAGAVSVKGTPEGTVSQPTFTGTGTELVATFTGGTVNSTGTYKPEGTVSKPTFSGTQATITVS